MSVRSIYLQLFKPWCLTFHLCTLFLSCNTAYNPFSDYRNAGIIITDQTFHDHDTLEIFSTETLTITITVPDLIDSAGVNAPSNRLFDDGKWKVPFSGSSVQAGSYKLFFSFYDTGMQIIEFLTWRSNGDLVRNTLRCYLKTPLYQQQITAGLGDTVELFTACVKDDVMYEWDIGGNILRSAFCYLSAVIRDAENSGTGYLRVSDNTVRSPAVRFGYIFTDQLAPEISLFPVTYTVRGDTVITAEKNFYFTVIINDRGGERIDSASVNGMPFDRVQNNVYTRVFYGIDMLDKPLPLLLYASDNYIYRNVATAKYYLRYDPLMNKSPGARITVISPSTDSSVVSESSKILFVKLSLYSESVKDVKIIVESSTKDTAAEHDSIWTGTALLKPGPNRVGIKAVSGGSVLDSAVRMITYDTGKADTVKPVILEIRADGEIIKKRKHIVTEAAVRLDMIAFDEAGGLSGVFINGKEQPVDSGKFMWSFTAAVRHHPEGDTFLMRVVDSKGNFNERDCILIRNNKPQVIKKPDPPGTLIIGNTYTDTIKVKDLDGDPFSLNVINSDRMTVSPKGIIRYTPDVLEKGIRTFYLEADDGYEKSLIYTFEIKVIDKGETPKPVRFLTSEGDFPETVTFGESRIISLAIDSSTGAPPFSVRVLRTNDRTEYPVDETLSFILCCFDAVNAGEVPFMVTVQDSLLTADTLRPVIRLVFD